MHAGEPMHCKPCYDIAWNILIIKLKNRWSSDFELTADTCPWQAVWSTGNILEKIKHLKMQPTFHPQCG